VRFANTSKNRICLRIQAGAQSGADQPQNGEQLQGGADTENVTDVEFEEVK